jgi:hypothetical protein
MDTPHTGEIRNSAVNGSAVASIVAAGIGAFAMGGVVLLAEAGLWSAPTLYGPAGGLSGRTTVAVVVWLAAWGVLHARWRRREINPARALGVTLTLIVIGVLGTFPPVWRWL